MSYAESHSSSDGFISVCRSKRKRQGLKPIQHKVHSKSEPAVTEESEDFSASRLIRRINEAECDLVNSSFLSGAIERIVPVLQQAKIREIVCLGLGKLSECHIPRYQLAFLRCLQRKLDLNKVQYFDPVFTNPEKEVLSQLDGIVIQENLQGKYSTKNTLFYLPHCPKQITNNLLWRNWNLNQLGQVFLICNSFEQIITNSPTRFLQNNARFILQIAKHTVEVPIENNFKFTDIFNDISFHYFDTVSLKSEESPFWEAIEPTYSEEDLELITRTVTELLDLNDNGFENDAKIAD